MQGFQIVTNSFPAEYGRTGGGALLLDSLRGAELRGTLFEYLRNDARCAQLLRQRQPERREGLRFNQFGGNLGGPVYLPSFGEGGKAFSKSNRLFFFFNYEALRSRSRGNNLQPCRQ